MHTSTETILNRAINGDLDAFKKIVEKHQQFVYRAAFRLLAHKEDARDATQECFIRVWKNLHTFDQSKKLTTWLYKIIVNLCYDDLRKAYKKRRTDLDAKMYHIAEESDIEKETADFELAQKIRLISNELKPQQRTVFVLRDLQELEMKEIAEILNISLGAVKSNLFYARKNIREKLQKSGYVE